jgi:hypothetical protein
VSEGVPLKADGKKKGWEGKKKQRIGLRDKRFL